MALLREIIRRMLDGYENSSPYDKVIMLMQMRSLFNERTIQEGKDAIDICQNDVEFRILLGVGLKGVLWYYLIKRRGELLGV